jgi:chorismate-pyruvate lyase
MPFLAQFGDFDASSLDLLQRVLLVSDGTLTDTLEAAFLEPISLRKIAIQVVPARRALPELDVLAGEQLMERKSLLCGESSGRAYVYAESVLVLDRLPSRFREELVESDMPIGRLWSEHKLETWKELLTMSRHPMCGLAAHFQTAPESDCLVRSYRVISGGRPLMAITEHFPATYRAAS